MKELRDRVVREVQKVVVGQDHVIEVLLAGTATGGHVLLEGVPGVAKTLLANAFARAIGVDFKRVQFTADLQERGVLEASNSLVSTEKAQRLQLREGRQTVIDGPFAESKEMVGGFFLLNVATQAEALSIASTCPAAEWATVEVRGVGPCYED